MRPCLVGAVLVVLEAGARAQPAVQVEVDGICPTDEQVVAQLSDAGVGRGEVAWTARVQRDGPVAWLELTDDAGEPLVVRSIESDDCEALAAAFGVIVEAQLAAIATPRDEVGDVGVAAPALVTAPERALLLAVAGGVQAGADIGGLGQIEVGGMWDRWRIAAGFALLAPATDAVEMQRVRTEALDLQLRAGPEVHADRWYVSPAAGLGVRSASVTALDLEGRPGTRRWLPKASISLTSGRQLAGPVWLRAAVAGDLFLRTESYAIAPLGVVAASPRAAVSVTLGLEVRFSDRSARLAPRTGESE